MFSDESFVASIVTSMRATSGPRYVTPRRVSAPSWSGRSQLAPNVAAYVASSSSSTRAPTLPVASVATTALPSISASAANPAPA